MAIQKVGEDFFINNPAVSGTPKGSVGAQRTKLNVGGQGQLLDLGGGSAAIRQGNDLYRINLSAYGKQAGLDWNPGTLSGQYFNQVKARLASDLGVSSSAWGSAPPDIDNVGFNNVGYKKVPIASNPGFFANEAINGVDSGLTLEQMKGFLGQSQSTPDRGMSMEQAQAMPGNAPISQEQYNQKLQQGGGTVQAAGFQTPAQQPISFKEGLNDTQKAGITTLSQKPPEQWTQTDKDNWNYATNNSPMPGQQGQQAQPGQSTQKATLTSADGKQKTVVDVGSQQASQLLSSGWTLGTSQTANFIDSSFLADEPPINIDTKNNAVDNGDTGNVSNAGAKTYSEQQRKAIAEMTANQRPEDENDLLYKQLTSDLMSSYENNKSLETIKAEEKAKADILAQQQAVSQKMDEIDVSLAKSEALKSSYQAANSQLELKPQTLSQLQGAQGANYRNYIAQHNLIASDTALLVAQGKALEGKLNDATQAANDAINLRYQSQQDAINNKINMLNILIPQIDKKDKEYANAVKAIENRKLEALDERKSWMETAVNAGIFDAGVLKQIESSGSFADAMGIIGDNRPVDDESSLLGNLTEDQLKQFNVIQNQLRQDPDIKGFIDIRDSYNRVQVSAEDPSPAGDLALIFNYMKMLDPGSVVRESEFAQAAATGSFGDRLKAAAKKIQQGERLSDEMRNDFVNRANRLYQPKLNSYNDTIDFFGKQADTFGIPRDLLLRDYAGRNPIDDTSNNTNVYANQIDEALENGWTDTDVINYLGSTIDELRSPIEEAINAGWEDSDILNYIRGFNQGGGGTPTASVAKALNIPSGQKVGQCGRFVNKYTGLGVGDSYQSKLAKMNPAIKEPNPGMVFTMPYRSTGHCGFIIEVRGNKVKVKDSNWSKDEKVKEHWIDKSKITGLTYG